jgi:hypothetical protein
MTFPRPHGCGAALRRHARSRSPAQSRAVRIAGGIPAKTHSRAPGRIESRSRSRPRGLSPSAKAHAVQKSVKAHARVRHHAVEAGGLIRLKLQAGQSGRAIARSCALSPSTVGEYLGRIALAGLAWPLPPELDDDAAVERLLFPDEHHPVSNRLETDWANIHRSCSGGTSRSSCCGRSTRRPRRTDSSTAILRPVPALGAAAVTMRQAHHAAEKTFIDFSGSGLDVVAVLLIREGVTKHR